MFGLSSLLWWQSGGKYGELGGLKGTQVSSRISNLLIPFIRRPSSNPSLSLSLSLSPPDFIASIRRSTQLRARVTPPGFEPKKIKKKTGLDNFCGAKGGLSIFIAEQLHFRFLPQSVGPLARLQLQAPISSVRSTRQLIPLPTALLSKIGNDLSASAP
jgi:hypothetical protein